MKRSLILTPVLAAAALFACKGPAVPPAGNTEDKKTPEWPKITDVVTEKWVYMKNETVLPESFSVWYQEDPESDKVKLDPNNEDLSYTISGLTESKAGLLSASTSTYRYGWQPITIVMKDNAKVKSETQIFVAETNNPAGRQPVAIQTVKQPKKQNYDVGEVFDSTGMVVVVWFGAETAGATDAEGGIPVWITNPVINDSELRAARNESAKKVYVSHPDPALSTLSPAEVPVYIIPKPHRITLANGSKLNVLSTTAVTGQAVPLLVNSDEANFQFKPGSLKIEQYTPITGQSPQYEGDYTGQLTEISVTPADGAYEKKYVFFMPRYDVTINAEYLTKMRKVTTFQYKIGSGSYKSIPAFDQDSAILDYELILSPTDAADPSSYLNLEVALEDVNNIASQGTTTITIKRVGQSPIDNQSFADTDTNVSFNATYTAAINNGSTITFEVILNYNSGGASPSSTTRSYKLAVQKPDSTYAVVFGYTGEYQTFLPWVRGMYQIEMWGADGGTGGGTAGGTGGYVTGKIVLDPDARIAPGSLKIQPIYIYVGGAGGSVNSGYDGGAGGWNGGGAGGGSGNKGGAGGGGATSISLVKGAWNDLDVLANRIMVAGGGGGAGTQGRGTGAQQVSGITQPGVAGSPGGGVAGSAARTQATNANTPANSYGGTYSMKWYGTFENYYTDAQRQVALTVPNTFAPGQEPSIPADISFGFNGQGFGIGGNGRPGDAPNKQYGDGQNGKGGGGGGWWGGRVSMYSGDSYGYGAAAGGGGGSSYVSGFDFCKSLTLAVVDPSTFETSFTSTQVGQPYNGGQGQPSLRSPQVGEVRFGAIAMNDWVRPPAQPATPIQYDALDTLAGINSGSAVPPNPVVVSSGPKNGYVKIKLLSDSVSSIATWRN